jgi:hypothetical protein
MIESNSPNKGHKIAICIAIVIGAFALGVGFAYILTLLAHKIS